VKDKSEGVEMHFILRLDLYTSLQYLFLISVNLMMVVSYGTPIYLYMI